MASLSACQARTPAEDLQSSQGESSHFAHRASKMRGSSVWVLASWNVRTLLDIDGSIETARNGVGDAEVVDERKIDQVVGELNRYKVDVAALQETKWFGSGVYEVGESVVLAAGRPVPGDGVVKQRGEGVAVVLSGVAVSAWKDSGKCWKAWSSRLISVKLKVARGNRNKCFVYVFSCYAPTYAASREEKNAFYGLLQQALSSEPSHYLTCCSETSMLVWVQGKVVMIHGGMREGHMGMGS